MLTSEQYDLLAAARKAANCAYAPYSRFRVGAAVLTREGVFCGANIENGSANLGICAERVAIAHARMHSATTIIGIAICCRDGREGQNEKASVMPCGGCRQWLAELAPDAWLVTDGIEKVFTVGELLPLPFTRK